MTIQHKFERVATSCKRLAISKSTFYSRIQDGYFPPLIQIGQRSVATLEHETTEIISAIAAGANQNEMKALVASLVEKRKELS